MGNLFSSLQKKQQMKIALAMLMLIVPVALYALQGSLTMLSNKQEAGEKYTKAIEVTPEQLGALVIPESSVPVSTGIYMESIQDVSVANNQWKSKFLLWFRWNDRDDRTGVLADPADYPGERFIVGNGNIDSKVLMIDRHDPLTGDHYQQYRITATVEKYFDTTRYPLESHQLKIFIEDERDMSRVRYVADSENSELSPYLTIAGFDVLSHDDGIYLNEYASTMNDPVFENANFETSGKKTMEYVFVTRVNRSGYGLFLKAFLSLFGMLLWVCIGLYNCAYNEGDALGAMNTGIFGAVSSMIVGMNLLSDARGSGLIEYVNFFALAMILVVTIYVMHINHCRKHRHNEDYVACYSQALFWTVGLLTVGTLASLVLCAAM